MEIIQAFWFGRPLSTMERLSIASFAAHGHEVHLYAYEDLGVLSPGAVLKDAAEIMPERSIYRDNRGSFSSFANMFRYKLLLERGGWWMDLDMVCLQPFDFGDEYVFATEPDLTVTNAAFKVPPGCRVMTYAYKRCVKLRRKRRTWGLTGPALLAEAVEACGLTDKAVDHGIFIPVDWPDWEDFLDPERVWHFEPQTRALHLWQAMWVSAGRDKNAEYPPACLYETLKKRYL